MTAIPDSHRDLLDGPTVAGFTTIGPSGHPQTSAVWFLLDGDVLKTSVVPMRQRYKNLVRVPKASLFAIDPDDPFRTIDVRGDVTFEPDPDLVLFDRLLAKYGAGRESFTVSLEDRITVSLHPVRVRV